jgi:uncharacterized membrane protein
MTRHQHPANIARHDDLTPTERRVESFVQGFGSLRFLLWQTAIIAVWIILNMGGWFLWHWDPYPFILLNLVFSTQAAYAAPLILLAQNRQAERDRIAAEHDYTVNQSALDRIGENTDVTKQTAGHVQRIVAHLGIDGGDS